MGRRQARKRRRIINAGNWVRLRSACSCHGMTVWWRQHEETSECAGMISAAATISKTTAIAAAAMDGRWRRLRHSAAVGSASAPIVVLGLVGWALGIDPSVLDRRRRDGQQHGNAIPAASPANLDAQRRPERPDRRLRRRHARQYRGRLERDLPDAMAAATRRRVWCSTRGVKQRRRLRLRQAAMGPFYCPTRSAHLSRHVVLPRHAGAVSRLQRQGLRIREAYVIAHEVGHHVQNCSASCPRRRRRSVPAARRRPTGMQVRVELQADCLAGVWAHHSDQRWNSIEPGDVEAPPCRRRRPSATTGCRSRRKATSCPTPSPTAPRRSASAGSAIGLKDGKVSACDTFSAAHRFKDEASMPGIDETQKFVPLKIAVLTVSDTRELADDKSGTTLVDRSAGRRPHRWPTAPSSRTRSTTSAAGEDLDRRQGRSTSSSPPAAPASPAAT